MNKLDTLITGLAFGESPRWHNGKLWLCNWAAQEIVAVSSNGAAEVVLRLPFATFPFSIDWLRDGRLLIVSASDQPVLVREADGSLEPYTATQHGWNEVVVDGRGNVFVNAPGFDLLGGGDFAAGGVSLINPDGSMREVAGDIAFPNGMAVSPDGDTLLVADSYGHEVTAFDINADGTLSGRRVWADLGDGTPDGICLDAEGALWYADVPNRCCVRVLEGGEVLDTVQADRGCFACMLGGPDGRTLYITAAEWRGPAAMDPEPRTGVVYTVQAPAPHAGRP